MNKINWLVRIKNPVFWTTFIPAVLLLAQTVAAAFGFTLDLSEIGGRLIAVVDAVFSVLMILGIVNDPTTAGVGDSTLALSYDAPKPKNSEDK